MKPFTKAFIILVLGSAVHFSCSKSGTGTDSGNTTNSLLLVKSFTRTSNNPGISLQTTNFTYDNMNRLTRRATVNGETLEYTYSPGQVVGKYYGNDGIHYYSYIYSLNSEGLVSLEQETLPTASSYEYTYNPDKTVATKIVRNPSNPSMLLTHYYTNGNLDSIRNTDLSTGRWLSSIYYEYYLNLLRSIDFVNQGMGFRGKLSKNLTKSSLEKFPPVTAFLRSDFQYEVDNSGRQVKSIIINTGSQTTTSVIDTFIHTYY